MESTLRAWHLPVGLGALEVAGGLVRQGRRSSLYNEAQARAKTLGRPLIVIGSPTQGIWNSLWPVYGCGDVCVDLTGCSTCPSMIKADITKPLPGLSNDSGVVFCSCVLEYLEDPQAAWKEILRIAGSGSNVFLVTVQWWTPVAVLFYPGAKWLITRPAADTIEAHAVALPRLLTAGIAAWWILHRRNRR